MSANYVESISSNVPEKKLKREAPLGLLVLFRVWLKKRGTERNGTNFLPTANATMVEWFLVKKYLWPGCRSHSSLSESCWNPALFKRFFASSETKEERENEDLRFG